MKKQNAYLWLAEPLMDEPTYEQRPMFGCVGCYIMGRLVLVLADRDDPWRGVLVPTMREHHQSLKDDFSVLIEHPVLGKWLYVADSHDDFESTAVEIVEAIASGDERLGVEPSKKRFKKAKKRT